MAVTLNASTSNGLVTTADTTGNLSLQSNGTTIAALTSTGLAVTGAGTFSTTLGVTGNVGIGIVAQSDMALTTQFTNSNGLSGTGYRVARFVSTSAAAGDQPGIILGYDTAGSGIIAGATNATGSGLALWTYNGAAWGSRLAISSAGAVTIPGTLGVSTGAAVGGATPGAGGIAFPATAVAVADANTLDDYEEGTWTPTINGSTTSGTGTYTTQQGTYTKIGNSVRFQAYIVWTAHTGTGQLEVANYPFASTAETTPISLNFYGGPTFVSGNFVQAYKNPSSTTSGTAQTSVVSTFTSVTVSSTGEYFVSGIYKVA